MKLAGRYQLVREITEHGHVHVYEARDDQAGQPVIIRAMEAETDEDLESFVRFQHEGVVISRLKHPNIWQTKSTFLEGRTTYIVAEWVAGPTLGEILSHGPLPLRRAKSIGQQIAAGLAHAHAHGVIHRDLDLENIVVAEGDRVKIRAMREFGTARVVRGGPAAKSNVGLQDRVPYYIAPEQIAEEQVDARADLYSLGALLYHMVTGQPPFPGNNALQVARAQVETAPRPPHELNPALPLDWEALILQLLEKQPEQRVQTAAAVERTLATLPTHEIRPDEIRPTRPTPSPATRRCPQCGREGRGAFCGGCGSPLPG